MPTSPSQFDFSPLDHTRMAQALAAAENAMGLSDPNPRVGCVVVSADGQHTAVGHTQAVGHAHAEIMALRDAHTQGWSLAGSTVYVTLEPCSHHGRTPPCSDALIQAGVARIVVAIEDPNPLVSGQGIARLRATGITVDVGLMADAAYDINIGFFSRMTRQRPWVRVKAACSLDGRTALANGQSQWITGEAARADGHRWRKRSSAVLTGIGTVLADNPRLDVRHVPTARQPQPVVLDSRLRTPPNAHCVTRGPENGALIYTLQSLGSPSPYPASTEIITTAAQDNRVAIGPVLHDLARRGVNELHVEAGAALNAALLAGQWVDEWLIYMAPSLLGAGRGMLEGFSLTQLPTRPPLQFQSVEHLGDDLRLLVRPRTA